MRPSGGTWALHVRPRGDMLSVLDRTCFSVHIFVRMEGAESKYLCGVPADAVSASIAVEWADRFKDKFLCPECREKYAAEYDA